MISTFIPNSSLSSTLEWATLPLTLVTISKGGNGATSGYSKGQDKTNVLQVSDTETAKPLDVRSKNRMCVHTHTHLHPRDMCISNTCIHPDTTVSHECFSILIPFRTMLNFTVRGPLFVKPKDYSQTHFLMGQRVIVIHVNTAAC